MLENNENLIEINFLHLTKNIIFTKLNEIANARAAPFIPYGGINNKFNIMFRVAPIAFINNTNLVSLNTCNSSVVTPTIDKIKLPKDININTSQASIYWLPKIRISKSFEKIMINKNIGNISKNNHLLITLNK